MGKTPETSTSWFEAAAGHYWTLSGAIGGVSRGQSKWRLGRNGLLGGRNWSTTLEDKRCGEIELHGRLHEIPGASTIVIIVHGLGGSPNSPYVRKTAAACQKFGWSSLCLTLRGSDLCGQDFYHAGLIADVDAALSSEKVAKYPHVHIIGHSLGGHMVLRWVTFQSKFRGKIVAICPPLDLYQSVVSIDSPSRWLYRHYLLHGLRQIYRAVALRRPVPYPVEKLASIQRIMDWDEYIVAPYHGFEGAFDYYRKMSVASRLEKIGHDTLIVHTTHDPMVRWKSVSFIMQDSGKAVLSKRVQVRTLRHGGHCGFPPRVDLGLSPNSTCDQERGIYSQILAWCAD